MQPKINKINLYKKPQLSEKMKIIDWKILVAHIMCPVSFDLSIYFEKYDNFWFQGFFVCLMQTYLNIKIKMNKYRVTHILD